MVWVGDIAIIAHSFLRFFFSLPAFAVWGLLGGHGHGGVFLCICQRFEGCSCYVRLIWILALASLEPGRDVVWFLAPLDCDRLCRAAGPGTMVVSPRGDWHGSKAVVEYEA